MFCFSLSTWWRRFQTALSNLYTLEPVSVFFCFQGPQTLFSCRCTAKKHNLSITFHLKMLLCKRGLSLIITKDNGIQNSSPWLKWWWVTLKSGFDVLPCEHIFLGKALVVHRLRPGQQSITFIKVQWFLLTSLTIFLTQFLHILHLPQAQIWQNVSPCHLEGCKMQLVRTNRSM